MKPRSPVLGYNHNVRYAQMLWHVQTEDSGVQNPHIFTHLFHDGTILATKKLDYDASADVTTVQKLMQSQHKLMLRELKSGVFDTKIEARYGPIQRESRDTDPNLPIHPEAAASEGAPDTVEMAVSPPRSTEDEKTTVPDLSPMLTPPPAQPPTAEPVRPAAAAEPGARPKPRLTPSRPSIPVVARPGTSPTIPGAPSSPPPTIGGRAAARSAPPTIGSARSGAQAPRPPEGGVVVARQTVIVGKETGKQREAADFWATGATERRPPPETSFGGDLISEKSLDEVILAYLSEDAPKK